MLINYLIEDYYKEKYIAFVDVLGFKDIVKNIKKLNTFDPTYHYTDADAWNKINQYYNRISRELLLEQNNNEIKITYISDCLIISSEKIFEILKFLFYLQSNMIFYDADNIRFLTRGFLTKGHFIHSPENNIIFGDAYQRAYMNEEKNVITPRIVTDIQIVDEIISKQLQHFLELDKEDNNYFIDYLYRLKIDNRIIMREELDIYLERQIEKHKENSNIIRKYCWLSNYYENIKNSKPNPEKSKTLKSLLGYEVQKDI